MNYQKFFILIFFLNLFGCSSDIVNRGYVSLGIYDTRIEAQNKAICHLLEKYESLPKDGYYKVVYSFRDDAPDRRSKNSLWYDRGAEKLALELDVNSGTACSWQEVSKTTLEQAGKSADGMLKIDSLSKPNQPTRQCL